MVGAAEEPMLQLTGVTKANYFDMTARLTAALGAAGGWILAHQQFSNLSLCLNFEISREHLPRLAAEIAATGFVLSPASQASLQTLATGTAESVAGTLQVTFIHNDPDLVVPLPLG